LADFLNWTAVDAGTSITRRMHGYTVGAAAEWYQGALLSVPGVFDLSNVPNSEHSSRVHEYQKPTFEIERRHEIAGRPGKVLLTLFDSPRRMACSRRGPLARPPAPRPTLRRCAVSGPTAAS